MTIDVRKPSDAERQNMSAEPIWEKEESVFPWTYDSSETCLLLEGEVTVTPIDQSQWGAPVSFRAGDLVTFPKGMSCTWDIKKAVRKHYRFT